ncbi:MAG: porin [Bradyrhizobium sp.]|nr:porin [Bradyrhizobium sp.]
MKAIRTLILLSSAASLSAVASANAADLPVKAKAIEYVRVCSLYGAGFWYIPGTDTCIRIGGYLRADVTFDGSASHGDPAWSGDSGQRNRYFDDFIARSRMVLQVDTRTATEYGVVRTFGHLQFQFNNFGTANPSAGTFGISLPGGLSGSTLNGEGGGYALAEYLFIQFAGFTFGRSASAYATPWQGFPSNISSFLMGGQNSDIGVNNIQYTAQFGNGVSGTIGLEDPSVQDRTSIFNLSTGLNAVGTTGYAYGGTHSPDINGNIRVDQAWGLFQISAAAHEVDASYNILTASSAAPTNLSEISGHPETKWGGSVMAALQVKNLPTGAGDDVKIDASYAKGLTKNVIATSSASPNFALFGGSNRAYQSIGFGATTDAVFLPVANGGTGDLKLTEAWGMRGAFTHNWDPHWSSALFGSASWVHYDGSSTDITSAKGQYCFAYMTANKLSVAAGTISGDFSCNPDYLVTQLGFNTRWTPVKNLTFTGEVMWFHLDQNFTGTALLTPSAPKPATTYEFKDQDAFQFQVRAQRNF